MITIQYAITRTTTPVDHRHVTAALHAVGWRGTMAQKAQDHDEQRRKASLLEIVNKQQHAHAIKQEAEIVDLKGKLSVAMTLLKQNGKTEAPEPAQPTKDTTIMEAINERTA